MARTNRLEDENGEPFRRNIASQIIAGLTVAAVLGLGTYVFRALQGRDTPDVPALATSLDASRQTTATTRLQPLGAITVRGNAREGTQVTVPRDGAYRIEYRSGSYSTYATNAIPDGVTTWLTAIVIFRNPKPLWAGNVPDKPNALLILADTGYRASAQLVEESAVGSYVETDLSAGDVLTLVGVDEYNYYAENPGQVTLEWFVLS